MVRIDKVNKYFNRRKKNEIHVIDNTSIELEEKGLVALLGPSGCGKTTLLNVIGGLDKVSQGAVYIDDQRITGRMAGKIDEIRNLNIGYIFQNYNLIDNKTVYDNVAMVLTMVGIKNPEEIDEKVRYALELVGMYRYRNRYADMLSGGERQRVGIARAIAKNPSIIIADEPTGNLDSRNTLEVMNIIKSISKEKLVILVTHEEKLANFYASRIIRLLDGRVVSDMENQHSDNLDYRLENKIYLKDLPRHESLSGEGYDIRIFNDQGQPLKLDIVIKKGNVYIQTKESAERLEIVDENSSIELVDEHYKEMTKEEYETYEIDKTKLEPKGKKKHSSIFSVWTMMGSGFKSVTSYHILKKILLLGFFASAMFIMYSLSGIAGALNMPDSKFVTANKDYLAIEKKKVDVVKFLEYEKNPMVDYILPGTGQASFNLAMKEYIQTSKMSVQITGSLTASDTILETDLVAGKMVGGPREIVIDKQTIKSLQDDGILKQAGVFKAEDLIGRNTNVANMGDFTIVGVTDRQEPTIYVQRDQMINILANGLAPASGGYGDMGNTSAEAPSDVQIIDVALKEADITLKKGRWATGDYEVMVNEKNAEEMPLNKEIKDKVYGTKLKVVGYYTDRYGSDAKLVNADTVKYNLIDSREGMVINPKDKNKSATVEEFRETGVNIKDIYKDSKDNYKAHRWENLIASLVVAGVIMLISFIEIYLIMRASFLSRVKEVGVLRAIGVKKQDVYKMFVGEILAITLMASMPGYLFMAFITHKLSGVMFFKEIFLFNANILGLGILMIFVFNLVFGLLPVFKTLRQTPAAILARTDVN